MINSTARHAICIQCHKDPEIINALIQMLPKEHFDLYIHVDMKSDIYDNIIHRENVFFSRRRNVKWGQVSQIKATLELFDIIPTERYKYIHLISGNDFICKPIKDFCAFFDNNDNEYIECTALPENSTWIWQGRDRYSVWYPLFLIKRPCHKLTRLFRVLYREFIMRTVIFKRRNAPCGHFYGGSSWFSVTGKMVNWMKKYISNHKEYLQFFEHSLCGDEIFFSTLAMLSPYSDKITNKCLRFMIWEGSNSGGPKELTEENIDDMLNSGCFFGRKIRNTKLVDILKEKLS